MNNISFYIGMLSALVRRYHARGRVQRECGVVLFVLGEPWCVLRPVMGYGTARCWIQSVIPARTRESPVFAIYHQEVMFYYYYEKRTNIIP